ncbi:odorant receptor 49b-like, partial [Diabrotica undecimpunctata]|uniref:odorant receptor 49b-like n=1 Tax=Diabrotica undecimpunctata TaxID=50387 RepID=UPI003B63D9BE
IIFLAIDTALTGSLIHLISQTMIVNEAFKYIDKDIDENQSIRNIFLIKEIRLVKCVNELQKIYRGFEILEEMCSWQILIQCGLATLLLCCLTYIIPLVTSKTEGFCCVVFLCACLGNIFILSYCCQTFTLELQNVALSVYETEWPFYPLRMKKIVLFLLKRLQKPADLTAGKMFTINLTLFNLIIQRSYSFYTLINASTKKV